MLLDLVIIGVVVRLLFNAARNRVTPADRERVHGLGHLGRSGPSDRAAMSIPAAHRPSRALAKACEYHLTSGARSDERGGGRHGYASQRNVGDGRHARWPRLGGTAAGRPHWRHGPRTKPDTGRATPYGATTGELLRAVGTTGYAPPAAEPRGPTSRTTKTVAPRPERWFAETGARQTDHGQGSSDVPHDGVLASGRSWGTRHRLVLRNPLPVARSLEARDHIPMSLGLAMWDRHLRTASDSQSPGLPTLVLEYDSMLAMIRLR